jgi:hypothetical protein
MAQPIYPVEPIPMLTREEWEAAIAAKEASDEVERILHSVLGGGPTICRGWYGAEVPIREQFRIQNPLEQS